MFHKLLFFRALWSSKVLLGKADRRDGQKAKPSADSATDLGDLQVSEGGIQTWR